MKAFKIRLVEPGGFELFAILCAFLASSCILVAVESPQTIERPRYAPAEKPAIDSLARGLETQGWWQSEWFGTYYKGVDWPWIYHAEHGWLYIDYRFHDPDHFFAYYLDYQLWILHKRY